jgi:hypothetical protein
MKSQKEGGFGPPWAVTPWKKKKKKFLKQTMWMDIHDLPYIAFFLRTVQRMYNK